MDENDMGNSVPITQTVKISDAKDTLSNVVSRVHRKEARIVLEENGVPVVAIIAVDDLDRLTRLEREREERFAVIDRMREAFADIPAEEIAREAERSVAEARERLRQRASEAATRTE